MEKSKTLISCSENSAFVNRTTLEPFHITESLSKLDIINKSKFHKILRPVIALTSHIIVTYKNCNDSFQPVNKLPRRILTQPSEGVLNHGLDNEESNLICRVHDILNNDDVKYTILDLLGTGTFGQVFRCQKDDTKEVVAIKVIKNKPAYHNQGQLEAKIAKLLNQKFDKTNEKYIVRLLQQFECKGHICLVFELLSMSLLDILTQNQFRGLPLNVVQRFTKQILTALLTFQEAEVIHCDLKPENILLAQPKLSTTTPSNQKQTLNNENNPSSSNIRTDDQTKQLTVITSNSNISEITTNVSSSVGSDESGIKMHHEKSVAVAASSSSITSSRLSKAMSLNKSLSSTTNPTENSVISSFNSPVTTNASTSPCTNTDLPKQSLSVQSSPTNAGTIQTGNDTAANNGISPTNSRSAMWSELKVIDLGSACFEGQTMYSYIQSRFCKFLYYLFYKYKTFF